MTSPHGAPLTFAVNTAEKNGVSPKQLHERFWRWYTTKYTVDTLHVQDSAPDPPNWSNGSSSGISMYPEGAPRNAQTCVGVATLLLSIEVDEGGTNHEDERDHLMDIQTSMGTQRSGPWSPS